MYQTIIRVQTSGVGFTVPREAVLAFAVALVCGGVLLAARVGPVVTAARDYEGELLFGWFLALLAWPVAGVVAIYAIARVVRGRVASLLPLGAALAALLVQFLPLASTLREVDDARHRAAREEIARRVEAGELQPYLNAPLGAAPAVRAPPEGLVALADYPWAVSTCGGHRLASVRVEDGATRITFCPHGGWRNGGWWIVYDSADRAPDLAEQRLGGWGFERVERLRERWYRLVRE